MRQAACHTFPAVYTKWIEILEQFPFDLPYLAGFMQAIGLHTLTLTLSRRQEREQIYWNSTIAE